MIKKSIKDYNFTNDEYVSNVNKSNDLIIGSSIIFYDDELKQISDYTTMINRYTFFGTIISCYIVHIYINIICKN